MRCAELNVAYRRCGNFAVRGSARCFWHTAPGDPRWETLRRAARSKGARVMHSQQAAREVGAVLAEAGWPEGLRALVLRSLARGLSGQDAR